MTPADIRAIAEAVGGQTALARRLGTGDRTVRGWCAEPPRSAPERPDDLIDAWAVAVIEGIVADLAAEAARSGTLAGKTIKSRALLPAVGAAVEKRMRARLADLARLVLPAPVTVV